MLVEPVQAEEEVEEVVEVGSDMVAEEIEREAEAQEGGGRGRGRGKGVGIGEPTEEQPGFESREVASRLEEGSGDKTSRLIGKEAL